MQLHKQQQVKPQATHSPTAPNGLCSRFLQPRTQRKISWLQELEQWWAEFDVTSSSLWREAERSLATTSHSGVKTNRFHIQKNNYPSPYPLSTHQPFWPVIIKAGKPISHSLCLSSSTLFFPTFPPNEKINQTCLWEEVSKKTITYQPKRLWHRWGMLCIKLIDWEH